jgi:poly-gamma-glutamate synthesis protein (capsule biosynthesis protein)
MLTLGQNEDVMADPPSIAPGRATLAFVGDLMFGRLVDQELHRRDPEWFWGDVLGVLRGADAVFGNLECAVTTREEQWRRTPKTFHFRAHPACVDVLKAGNVRFVSLANNHALDFETAGLFDTIHHLEKAGIACAGAGADAQKAAAPALVRVGALTVAVFAVTDNMPEAGAAESDPGVCYVDAEGASGDPSASDIAAARALGADLVVVSAHLGPNMLVHPVPALRVYKQRLVASGADLVYGHSAHVVQGLERIGRALVLHDTGDFIDDYAVDEKLRNDLSFVFLVEATKAGFERIRLVPVRLYLAQTRLAAPDEAEWLCARMQDLSREYGVELARTEEGLSLELSGTKSAAGPFPSGQVRQGGMSGS